MKKKYRLNRSTEILRVRRAGKTTAHPLVALVLKSNNLSYNRCAIIAGKSIGGAVERNRAKRQSREVFKTLYEEIEPGYDLIFILRKEIRDETFANIRDAFLSCIKRSGLSVSEK